MSVIRKYPYIEGVIDGLSKAQKESLLQIMNTAGNNVNADFKNMPEKGVTPVYFKLDETNFKTGILIYTDAGCTLIAYHRFQDVLLLKLNVASATYERINEYCDINELRRILTVGDEVTAGEINSGNAEENMVLAADGDGGAEWKDVMDTITPETVESGDAVQLFGFDAQGNLVKDDMPEGIVVDDSVIEDSTNAVAGGAVYDFAYSKEDVDAKLETKANVDGNYPTMTVGVADNLSPYDEGSGINQHAPFNFQASGTNNGADPTATVGELALLQEKRGNTMVVNNQAPEMTIANWGVSAASEGSFAISNGEGTYTVINPGVSYNNGFRTGNVINTPAGHKILLIYSAKASGDFVISGIVGGVTLSNQTLTTNYKTFFEIAESQGPTYLWFACRYSDAAANDTFTVKDVAAIDLTQWFNGDIPQDLLDSPENLFRYYQGSLAFNEGTLVNSDGRYLKAIGRNQWDGTNDVKVVPNSTYYIYGSATLTYKDKDGNTISTESKTNETFDIPANCLSVGISGDGNICISLYYEGESGYDEYYPYEELANIDTGTETLLAFDYKEPNGTIHKNTTNVDLGTLTWTNFGANGYFYSPSLVSLIKLNQSVAEKSKVKIERYYNVVPYNLSWNNDLNFFVGGNGAIYIRDDSCGTDASALTTKLNGVHLQYLVETPTTEQGAPYSENVTINDFGSMDFSGSNGVPQGNLIFYPVDYKAYLDTLHKYTDGDPDNLALKRDLSGLVEQEDLSSEITEVAAGLTYIIKKAYKTGNIVNLTIDVENNTGSAINENTTLFAVGGDLLPTPSQLNFIGYYAGEGNVCRVQINKSGQSGNVSINKQFEYAARLTILVSYAVA